MEDKRLRGIITILPRNIHYFIILSLLCFIPVHGQIPMNSEGLRDVLTPADSTADRESGQQNTIAGILDTNIVIPSLDFSNIDIKDAFTALIRTYKLSVYLDPSVTGKISLRLDNVSLHDALLFIIKEYGLGWERTGNIVKIFKPISPPPVPEPLEIQYDGKALSMNLKDADLRRFIDEIIIVSDNNIIIDDNAAGKLTGRLASIEFEKGMKAILNSNGFSFSKIEDIYHVGLLKTGGTEGKSFSRFSVSCENELVSISVKNAPISDILSALTEQCGVGITLQGNIEGTITASYQNQPLVAVLGYILKGTPYSYKKMSDIYFIGNKTSQELFTSKLIKLQHISNASIENLIPANLSNQVSVKLAKEHNGLLVTGPLTVIDEIVDFISKIDIPPAQVLFDAIVVDYNTTELKDFNLYADNTGLKRELSAHHYYPDIDYSATGENLNIHMDNIADFFNIKNIGHLSDNFYLRLKFMEQEGIANIKSRPQIAALNGHQASINIGVSQYYLLESETVYPSQQSSISTQTSQRFETIEADMSLEVTPWVTESGDIIVDIKPSFNTPAAQFDPDIPPTINRRILQSTVRLRDGETIVLGGMIQYQDNETIQKFPILGDIPILGRIFQNRKTTKSKTELMVYLTPHVYYGSEGSIDIESVIKK